MIKHPRIRKVASIAGFIGVLLIFLKVTEKPWPDVDIDLETCQPEGITARLNRAWDPLSFWVDQHVTLERALEQEDLSGLVSDCNWKRSDPKSQRECIAFYETRHRRMLFCLQHATKLCRNEGGRC